MQLYENWQEEARSAYLYGVLANCEANVLHRKLFKDLQQAALKQAGMWEQKMTQQNLSLPLPYKPDFRTSLVAKLATWFGAERIHFILASMKIRGMSVFTHYHSEHQHTSLSSSSNLRAAVFGMNDGLVSNMSLILGVAGAHAEPHFIILAGVAGLLAGACSMGAGEFISVLSQREVFEYQISIEQEELKEYPEEEKDELALIYEARGVPKDDARKIANLMIDNPETGLNTLVREELGLNPEDLVSPIGAMLSSFISFAIGACIPLLPFLLSNSKWNLPISICLTGGSLFLIGALLSLYTNRNPFLLGARMLAIGAGAGIITFLIGSLIGTTA
jgi:VIT1/CCC1 family predicted Fe2+/Mn2+ transporter